MADTENEASFANAGFFDAELRDSLIEQAKKRDEESFDRLLSQHKSAEVQAAAAEGVITLLRELYTVCASILDPKDKTPNTTQIMQKLILPSSATETLDMRQQAIDLIQAVQWLKLHALSLALPEIIKRLSRIADKYFGPDVTYADIEIDRVEAENLLLVVAPIVTFPEGAVAQFDDTTKKIINAGIQSETLQEYVDRVAALLQILPDDGELWGSYMIRTGNMLYYFQLTCDLMLAAQDTEGEDDDTSPNRVVAFSLAPSLLLPLVANRDELLKQLALPTPNAINQQNVAESTNQSPTLIATQTPLNTPATNPKVTSPQPTSQSLDIS